MHRLFKTVTALVLLTSPLHATNGSQVFGWGPRNRAMGGANGAAPVDSSTVLVNPAGLSKLPTSADLGSSLIIISSFADMRKATGLAVNVAAGRQRALQRYFISPFSGIIYQPTSSCWSFGIASVGGASGGVSYNKPFIKPVLLFEPNGQTAAETGAVYNTSTTVFTIQTGFAASYQHSDRLSLGAALNSNVLFFSSDSAVDTSIGLQQTRGRGRLDITYGIGFTVGALYDIDARWAIGLTYVSPQWFEQSKLYSDLVPRFILPPQVRLGLAFRPSNALLLTTDIKWIGWQEVGIFRRRPSKDGFGWRDQYTLGVGMQYDWSMALTLRGGYNYGKTPIRPDVLFANLTFPVFYEHRLCFGFEVQLTEHSFIALSTQLGLRKHLRDNGKGDTVSQLGKGAKASMKVADVSFAWTIKF